MIQNNKNNINRVVDTLIVIKYDTITIVDYQFDNQKVDSLAKQLKTTQDSLTFYRDSISYDDYMNARRIEKIKYYIKICENNSKNKQFFFGWIKRTMTE
jgi:hypothetical protein